jgi:hypothetical protein
MKRISAVWSCRHGGALGNGSRSVLARLLFAGLLLTTGSTAALAVPPVPLQGRDINGNAVAASAAEAVFEYDPNLNITWLRNWNANGSQSWDIQMAWAASLSYFGGGWRLPTSRNQDGSDPCGGPNCTGSEMGYLWYTELGNAAGGPLSNAGPFLNMPSSSDLLTGGNWSGTEWAGNPATAYLFETGIGTQVGAVGKLLPFQAVAVRPGDVASFRATIDVDGNGKADALTDGLLILRYLFGVRGDALVSGVLDPLATRTTAAAIEAYLKNLLP